MSAAGHLAAAPRPSARESLAYGFCRCPRPLNDRPARLSRAAASWHAYWCLCVPQLTLAEAVSARDALDRLAGPDVIPAARSLQTLFERHGLDDLAHALEGLIAP